MPLPSSSCRVAVLVGPERGFDVDSIDPTIRQQLEQHVQLVDYETAKASAETEPVDVIATFAHVLVGKELVTALSPSRALKAVVNYGVGVDHINLDEMRELGIPVCNTPGVLSGATADMAWALLMACARNIVQCDAYCRSDAYTVYRNMIFLGRDVHHKTIGIVGLGRIGTEIARRAKGFHMRILYHNRSPNKDAEDKLGATLVSLDDLLKESDYVVLVCPCTPETTGLISTPQLKLMKPLTGSHAHTHTYTCTYSR
ncbi:D-isomer specific 2-hydroxyacid dehydrogenase, variant [Salpingoeca rosetta]|uniref:D-isomer specific 2-hydroxyacid dehydrogenase, variant n=1 Tax=Salpingoeca rosetta (strain ATCC 50818 / BSB-021) TaxID=946362 RepID=F2ULE7_SALR5|nr:D-isomer specific 2-hydroxyacid dehydrogenase, variant [Salpingoeca rosetta]EGD77945.1 D-isomer specific 2-hydroxyacid dehydrogenase, variant [Salpingoeca rosetta]|eukprot:XP_004990008.1 D-isomer specific 2-hydroxyacid dehydrogenase, variant [Salpingoeca rosetta]